MLAVVIGVVFEVERKEEAHDTYAAGGHSEPPVLYDLVEGRYTNALAVSLFEGGYYRKDPQS